MVGYGVIEMSKKMFIDKNGYLRGLIEIRDGTDTPGVDAEYRAIMEGKPGDGYVYSTVMGEWVYEERPAETEDPELTAEEALDIIVGGGDNA